MTIRRGLKFETLVLLFQLSALLMLLTPGCAGRSVVTDASNTADAIEGGRLNLRPVYEKVTDIHPELTGEIEAFDAELEAGVKSLLEFAIAAKQGSGTREEYQQKLDAIVSILDRYEVEKKIPELKPGIDLIKKLLGVKGE